MNSTENTAAAISYYLDAANSIGIHLARKALWDGDRCNWTGSAVDAVNGSFRTVEKTFAADLYSGTSGIAWFLAQLTVYNADPILLETLDGTVNQVMSAEDPDLPSNYGYYGGLLGIACTLIETGEKCGRKDWQEAGWEKLLKICRKPVREFEVDVISGVAGAIPVLIGLYRRSNRSELWEALIRCGNFLIGKALKTAAYWSWQSMDTEPAMTGYSHGAAGVSCALLELYSLTGDAAYYTGAMMGFNFERAHYNPQLQNWPDFRGLSSGTGQQAGGAGLSYGEAWCHGAPGIALSRIRAWQITGEPTFRQEAEVALATTHRNLYNALANTAAPSNFSICHGLAGNADILLEAGQALGNPQYTQIAAEIGNYGIEKYLKNGITWPSGVNDPTGLTAGMGETPGLMLGLAGTGYYYLRLAFPGKIRSALLLRGDPGQQ